MGFVYNFNIALFFGHIPWLMYTTEHSTEYIANLGVKKKYFFLYNIFYLAFSI
jgi:hypothetical protein